MNKKIGILNYKSSNNVSLACALDTINIEYEMSEDFSKLRKYNKIIIPGIGNMGSLCEQYDLKILKKDILDFTQKGGIIYGICLGMQLFLDYSEEGGGSTLSLVPGYVASLKNNYTNEMNVGHKNLVFRDDYSDIIKKIFTDINKNSKFYFLHKYFCNLEKNVVNVVETNFNQNTIPAVFFHNRILGTQFHPELSGKTGLQFLSNFSSMNI